MGIWVRSQDKRILMPFNNQTMQIVKYDNNSFLEEEKPENISFGIVADDRTLGEYLTEAETLKVLDMIEGGLGSLAVFQMPPAGFSVKEE